MSIARSYLLGDAAAVAPAWRTRVERARTSISRQLAAAPLTTPGGYGAREWAAAVQGLIGAGDSRRELSWRASSAELGRQMAERDVPLGLRMAAYDAMLGAHLEPGRLSDRLYEGWLTVGGAVDWRD